MKNYKVVFDVKKGGEKTYRIDLQSETKKEAREKAETLWKETHKDWKGDSPHMFCIEVKVIKPNEEFLYHYFTQIER